MIDPNLSEVDADLEVNGMDMGPTAEPEIETDDPAVSELADE